MIEVLCSLDVVMTDFAFIISMHPATGMRVKKENKQRARREERQVLIPAMIIRHVISEQPRPLEIWQWQPADEIKVIHGRILIATEHKRACSCRPRAARQVRDNGSP